jgi:hypothetical protein
MLLPFNNVIYIYIYFLLLLLLIIIIMNTYFPEPSSILAFYVLSFWTRQRFCNHGVVIVLLVHILIIMYIFFSAKTSEPQMCFLGLYDKVSNRIERNHSNETCAKVDSRIHLLYCPKNPKNVTCANLKMSLSLHWILDYY